MFQVIVFSKPIEELGNVLTDTVHEAVIHHEYIGQPAVHQALISVEPVLLQRGLPSTHQIMIRYFPELPDATQFVFVGDEFKKEELLGAFQIYSFRAPGLIDRSAPNQLMGAVMGHYYDVAQSSKVKRIQGFEHENYLTVYLDGVGIIPEMLKIKAALDKDA